MTGDETRSLKAVPQPIQPIVRSAEQAKEDHNKLVEKVKALAFDNWPNEAGVSPYFLAFSLL